MRIVQVAAEFAPFAKAGGLGEVVLGLSRALTLLNHDVEIFLPKHSFIDPKSLQHLKMEKEFRCLEKGQSIPNTLWSACYEECQLRLIDARHPSGYFHRDRIYGYEDDIPRFLYFSLAVMEILKLQQTPIDILHLHDWHTAACALLARDLFKLKIGKIIFTIHNLEYQGKCATWDLDAIGLNGASYLTESKLQDPHYPMTINLLKGGIVYADTVNTVSPTYAHEILSPENGFGLHKLLQQKHIQGILNGIDEKTWDSSSDPYLAKRYSPSDSVVLIGKAKEANKAALCKRCGIKASGVPLIGAVTRLVPQKGIELLLAAPAQILELKGAFALLGSTPIEEIRHRFDALKNHYQHEPHILLHYDYDEELAHQIYAACDFLLVPSLQEPCGLTQLIALRYGTLPIARSTGGLKDTIFDCENPLFLHEKRNGFTFQSPTPEAQRKTLERAITFWKTEHTTFLNLSRSVMQRDYSWKASAQDYLRLYQGKEMRQRLAV